MSLDALRSGLDSLNSRLFVTVYLPTAVAWLYLLALAWAGAPDGVSPHRAWTTAQSLNAAQVGGLLIMSVFLALLVRPFQLAIVRLLEGYWPGWAGGLTRAGRAVAGRRFARLQSLSEDDLPADAGEADIQRAGQAGEVLRHDYPADGAVLPTRLGNVLAAAEEYAGQAYGLDAVTVWPRLYPLLSPEVRALVDDRRNSLDAACASSVTLAAAGVASAALLVRCGWWLLLPAAALLCSRAAYRGAVRTARAYGEAIAVAFDLHRLDLYAALHLPLPARAEDEQAIGEEISLRWRQGKAPSGPLDHTSHHSQTDIVPSTRTPSPQREDSPNDPRL
jgi:hypothetical protein